MQKAMRHAVRPSAPGPEQGAKHPWRAEGGQIQRGQPWRTCEVHAGLEASSGWAFHDRCSAAPASRNLFLVLQHVRQSLSRQAQDGALASGQSAVCPAQSLGACHVPSRPLTQRNAALFAVDPTLLEPCEVRLEDQTVVTAMSAGLVHGCLSDFHMFARGRLIQVHLLHASFLSRRLGRRFGEASI